jgi:hypothetical protein
MHACFQQNLGDQPDSIIFQIQAACSLPNYAFKQLPKFCPHEGFPVSISLVLVTPHVFWTFSFHFHLPSLKFRAFYFLEFLNP